MEQMDRSFFFVGINDYTHSDRQLRGCVNDVVDGLGFLLDIQFDMSRVVVCTAPVLTAEAVAKNYASAAADPEHDATYAFALEALAAVTFCGASRSDILETAAGAFRAIPNTHNIVLNWSGHGQLIDGAYHLAPADAAGQADVGAAQTMLRYRGLLEALGAEAGDSVLAVLDTCDAGSVLDSDYADRPQDLILTSGGPAQEISERYIGGQWRGLLIWSFFRVLEQYNAAHGAASGIEVSYGNVLRNVRALVAIFQGVEATPAVPQLHGKMANAAQVLHQRVGQTLSLPPGRTSYRAELVGGGVQMWTDVDDVGLYKLIVGGEHCAYILVNGGTTNRTVTLQSPSSVAMKPQDEMWFFDTAKLGGVSSATTCTFELVATESSPFNFSESLSGFQQGSVEHIPMLPQWAPAQERDTANFLNLSTSATYAFRITASQDQDTWNISLKWLKTAGTANPFKQGQNLSASGAMQGLQPNLRSKSYSLFIG